MVKRYDMEYGVNKFFSQEAQVIPVQSSEGTWVSFEDYAELQEEVEALKYWRKLALQFDGHRMNAMSMLKLVATGKFDMEEVRRFIAAAPVSGDEHLRQVRADAVSSLLDAHLHYGTSRGCVIHTDDIKKYASGILAGKE